MRFFDAFNALLLAGVALAASSSAFAASLPDGRVVTPIGFTIPVEGFATSAALSPDNKLLAVLSQDGGAVDVIELGEHSALVQRLSTAWATGMTWTTDGLYVTRGYSGSISRFSYDPTTKKGEPLKALTDLQVGGLLNGIAEDPATHRLLVARTANKQVVMLDDKTGNVLATLGTTGQPFAVAFVGDGALATLYDSDHVDVWRNTNSTPVQIATGPHPTQLLMHNATAYVANADGHDVVAIDGQSLRISRRIELGLTADPPPGQTPSGMALSNDGKLLFVTESGFNDVAVVDLSTGRVVSRIPAAWYPTDVVFLAHTSIDKDPRMKSQLFIVSAMGLGPQPNPGSEWDGVYTGIVQHIVIEPNMYATWSAAVARNNRFSAPPKQLSALPPIKHFVFIVKENKHFDEVFGDMPGANADPNLLVYGRKYTPNAHSLAEQYTLFDNFMGDGDRSDFGHSWTTQAMANDYLERNVHTVDDAASAADPRVAGSIWPIPLAGEDRIPIAVMNFDWFKDLYDLPAQPRVNVSAVFGPRGQLLNELQSKHISFRVYGEQMTMMQNGAIWSGLSNHADRAYPGAHIDFDTLDTVRAQLFLADVQAHGLASYCYLTLPTNHTAGTRAGFYTPASYVASNDAALGLIIQGLSKRPEWRNTVVFVTEDDPQGTGDHLDARRMPAFLVGPFAKRGFIDHTRYSIPSVLRTVEVLFGLNPLNIYDSAATPLTNALASSALVKPYHAIAANIAMQKNPGTLKSVSIELDGPSSLEIPRQEWISMKGEASYQAHLSYLRSLGQQPVVTADSDDDGGP